MLTPPDRKPVAWLPVGVVAGAAFATLVAFAGRYDYHRDELYFRVLGHHLAWGYVDQPPLTPLLGRIGTAIFGDTLLGLRLPVALIFAVSVIVSALIAREAGGGAGAQGLAAFGTAFGLALITGHVLNTETADLLIWQLVLLFAMRALLRDRPRSWLAAGLTVGIGLYNKHLVILLLLMLGLGLLLAGPRRVLLSPWLWAGLAIAVVVGLPNLMYQVANNLPQLQMAHAIAADKGADSRASLLPIQFEAMGLPFVPIWIAGLVTLFRDVALRPIRGFAVAYLAMVVVLFVIAGQPYYTLGLLATVYAIGCVPAVRWVTGHRWRQALLGVAAVLQLALGVVVAMPVFPIATLARTGITDTNSVTRDQIGWHAYVRETAQVWNALPAEERAHGVIITGNYGEQGALDRYGPAYHLPVVYSGHNALWYLRRPPESASVVLFVQQGYHPEVTAGVFRSCEVKGTLHNDAGIETEEEGASLIVCRGPLDSWAHLWPRVKHLS